MAQRKLTALYGNFHGRTDLLLRDFLLAPPSQSSELGGVSVDALLVYSRGFLINRFFHLWGEYCRHVVTASALGGCTTLSGAVLKNAQGITCVSDILDAIKRPSIVGPGLLWGDPMWTVRNANKIQPANLQQIKLGVGAVPYGDVRRVRNFIIHSNPHTRLEFDSVALKYSLLGANADDLLLHKLPGGGTIMETWVRDFQSAALDAIR